MKNAYQKAGVNVEAGYEVVDRIKKHAKRTEHLGVMGGLGGFGGAFDLSTLDVKEPVLISGTDGVGTKLMLAIEADKHDTIGIDCVAMCVNDILAAGAEPLYFLDYLATGKTNPEQVEQIVAGVAEGCHQGNMALIGGETAEMPDMYADADYDLAGFAVGVAEKSQLLAPEKVKNGDILIGLPSSGIHSNGYSLVRKIFFKDNDFSLTDTLPELGGKTLGEALLEPTRIYVESVLPLIKESLINGISHVTGGGFVENLPRMLPENLAVEINKGTWEIPAIFSVMKEQGDLKEAEMYEIFNMGIGMVLAVSPEKVSEVKTKLAERNEVYFEIGQVVEKEQEAILFNEVEK
ncbi:phosphoribosylformylglycinamidine cyclo-ligase [Vagococcus hydrophili]|uniref:Phosphoribosylformylglycinamidine cyclo-ligase n=1 Tax=Vagococcus hydrophili TaxID=2714947 RepID=A0A6G8AUW7_9ENTE|nr:phosphoribosylformylglycinamidine cyclo-ligase [Vagococcus hydrophili]QIL48854.1 phosphoribosylformylglycinamidine cyclo-ligase [Vagococcus hydrophili]